MNVLRISSVFLLSLLLTACFNDDDDDDNNDVNRISAIGKVSADGEPVQIVDPGALESDITSLFGNADDEPLAVEDPEKDTLEAIIARGKS